MSKQKKIVIVGAGWYGCHTYKILTESYSTKIKILILDKNQSIFDNSSNFNQNRLHLGYHYPRCSKTRNICKNGYHKFIKEYRDLLDFIDNNYYCISKYSFIDYNTYLQIYLNDADYNHTIIENTYLNNIEGGMINTKEKIINSDKVKNYFLKLIDNNHIEFDILRPDPQDTRVNPSAQNNKVIINDDIECDLLIDCTYNQQQLSKKNYVYENTISLLYKRVNFTNNFDSLTIMDGPFFSLFPRDITKQLYTLTHVKYTPYLSSTNVNDILSNNNINIMDVEKIKNNMEIDVKKYYKDFKKHFVYYDYFTSYKCKNLCQIDSRSCNIEKNGNIITVNCGKIIGIFEFEEYIKPFIKKFMKNSQ